MQFEAKIAPNCIVVVVEAFAGARAHHQGLRWLKPLPIPKKCLLAL